MKKLTEIQFMVHNPINKIKIKHWVYLHGHVDYAGCRLACELYVKGLDINKRGLTHNARIITYYNQILKS